ncbi:MAG: Lrp/AsnC family transcriptional regulator [Paracoccaceae bacterium]
MKALEEKDHRILDLIQKDCRLSNSELAASVGMSASACWRRVRMLEESGVIQRYGAVVDPARVGLGFHAIVHVHLTRHDANRLDDLISAILSRDEVQDCYATTGQPDYHIRVLCADLAAYARFLEDFLFRLPGVQSVQTNVVLKEIKRAGIVCTTA